MQNLVTHIESDKTTIKSACQSSLRTLDLGPDPCQVKPYSKKPLEKRGITEILNLS